jgi:hypothetical protein
VPLLVLVPLVLTMRLQGAPLVLVETLNHL